MVDSPPLHHALVQPRGGGAQRALLMLHGILGSGANLRGLAQRLVERQPSWAAVLVDLRGHGRSPAPPPPHTLASCAQDLCALEPLLPWPIEGAIGHSFGGKVALAYHRRRPGLRRGACRDSAPFARDDRVGSEETLRVIALLERAPASFATRDAFIDYVHTHGHSRAIADWLAMNLTRSTQGFRLRSDLTVIRALLDDYVACDLWPVLEESQAEIDLIVGGRSQVWGAAELARAQALAAPSQGRVRVTVLPDAGHWVHVDDLAGVVAALARSR
jgi:pimeloyl-ACP methyl ester carboxylesterase